MFGFLTSRPQRKKPVVVAPVVPIFTKSFTSTDQTITSAGALTLAHSLGAVPKLTRCLAVCQTAELNYSIGDLVEISPNNSSNSAADNIGMALTVDGTNVNIRFGSGATNTFYTVDKTTGASAPLTNTKWKLRVFAWA